MHNGALTATVYFEKRIRVKSRAPYDPEPEGSLSGHDGHLYTTVLVTQDQPETRQATTTTTIHHVWLTSPYLDAS
jgi:hypothetical protein